MITFSFFLKIFWGIVVGLIFSLIGAAGGLLSGFGFISLFHIVEPNSVKIMSQIQFCLPH